MIVLKLTLLICLLTVGLALPASAEELVVATFGGTFVDTETSPRVLMVNGSRQSFDRTTGKLSALALERKK